MLFLLPVTQLFVFSISSQSDPCLSFPMYPISHSFLSLLPWRWRQYVPPKWHTFSATKWNYNQKKRTQKLSYSCFPLPGSSISDGRYVDGHIQLQCWWRGVGETVIRAETSARSTDEKACPADNTALFADICSPTALSLCFRVQGYTCKLSSISI